MQLEEQVEPQIRTQSTKTKNAKPIRCGSSNGLQTNLGIMWLFLYYNDSVTSFGLANCIGTGPVMILQWTYL
jgi:hypothetical protein